MTRKQIENLYIVNDLKNYQLRNTEDLLKVHGINFKETEGYEDLTDENKEIYERFIINIFNAWGLESRALLLPKAINFVEHIEYLVKESPEDDYLTVAGGKIISINRDNEKSVLRKWSYEEYKYLESEKFVEKPKFYLRFEYQHGFKENGEPKNEWLHVTENGNSWY